MLLFGLGVGLIFLISVWSVIAVVIFISKSQSSFINGACITIGTVATVVSLLLPRQLSGKEIVEEELKVVDDYFFTRFGVILCLVVSILGGAGSLVYSLSEPVVARPLQKADSQLRF